MPDTYCYSTDGERYYGCFDTRESAIAEARAGCGHVCLVFTGRCEPHDLSRYAPDGEDIITRIQDNSEIVDVLSAVNPVDEAILTAAIRTTVRDWLVRSGEAHYFIAEDVEEHRVEGAVGVCGNCE